MSILTAALRLVLRVAFFPLGCALLAGTAAIEFMQSEPNWHRWREFNETVLDITGLKRFWRDKR